jgi:transcriptional regulator with XRE-family HTH domain
MSEPDLKTTLREFKEYLALSYESPREIAARVGVAQRTIWVWLSDKSQPKAKSLAKLRRFLDQEAKRPAQGDGIRPIEPVPFKIIKPIQRVRDARLFTDKCPVSNPPKIRKGSEKGCARANSRNDIVVQ